MDAVEDILRSWGFENLVDTFRENDIDMEVFENLNEEMLKELIPQVGTRYKFTKKLELYQNVFAVVPGPSVSVVPGPSAQVIECSGYTSESCSDTSSVTVVDVDCSQLPLISSDAPVLQPSTISYMQKNEGIGNAKLSEVLNSEIRGREILQSYKTLKKFSRSVLSELVIDHELKDHPDTRITSGRFKELAREIVFTFPGEFEESYYVPYHKNIEGKVCSAKGILWDKYVNKRKILRKIGLIRKRGQLLTEITEIVEDDVDCEDYLTWLNHNIMPWNTVMDYWTKTIKKRSDTFTEISTYFNTYPALKQPGGYSLLEIDFGKKYPKDSSKFFSKWPRITHVIIQLAEAKKENTTVKNFLNTHNYKSFTDDQKQTFSLLLLPLLIPPCPVKSKKAGARYKPSKIEIQQAFCCLVNDMSKFSEQLEGRRQKLLSINETLQPFVILVGSFEEITASYVLIDNIQYKLETPQRAVDIAFKSFHALSAKYPCEAEHVWLFMQKMQCFKCHKKFDTIKVILLHLKHIHRLSQKDNYKCVDCNRWFTFLNSYRKHLKTKHTDFHVTTNLKDNECSIFADHSTSRETIFTEINQSDENTVEPENNVANKNEIDIKKHCLILISKLYCNSLLPRNAVNHFIEVLNTFITDSYLPMLQNKIFQKMKDLPTTTAGSGDLLNEIQVAIESCTNPFDNLSTEYRRFKILETTTYFIKPMDHVIGTRSKSKLINGTVVLENVVAVAKFIPLRDIFQKLFSSPSVFMKMKNFMFELQNERTIISNFIQGELWKSKMILHNNKFVIPLIIYFDDYETGNPLGSHSGTNKLGAVYVSIASIPPEFQARLSHIFLALLFYSKDRKEFGNSVIFSILINELNYLRNNGIEILVNGSKQHIFFDIALIVGDNLGLHSILGMVESFSATLCCRFCMMRKQDTKSTCTENDKLLRTKLMYQQHVLDQNISHTGIKEFCIWNRIENFHFVENYSVDVMHDLLEGVCNYTLVRILQKFVLELKLFSLNTLNFRIKMFGFNESESGNTPPYLTADSLVKLKMSASEMLCFTTYLGLIIGDMVPSTNEVWKVYILMRSVLDIIMAPMVHYKTYILLNTRITEFLEHYVKIFGPNLKPKHHHLLHYGRVLKMSGPLILFWSMRFEAKHREAKMTANVSCSQKNILQTLALKHQLKLCYHLLSNSLCQDNITYGSVSLFNKTANYFAADVNANEVYSTKWVELKGTRYKINMCVVIDYAEVFPIFAYIKNIFLLDGKIFLLLDELLTVNFNSHYYAFEILNNEKVYLKSLTSLPNITPCLLTKKKSKMFISLRYR